MASISESRSKTQKRFHLSFYAMELDKAGNFWIVRYFPNREVVLQLRIRQYSSEFPAEFTCEIKLRQHPAFARLAQFEYGSIDLADEVDIAPWVCCFPEAWRAAFVAMASHWANLNMEAQFKSSAVVWKKGELNPIFVDSEDEADSEINGDDIPGDARIH